MSRCRFALLAMLLVPGVCPRATRGDDVTDPPVPLRPPARTQMNVAVGLYIIDFAWINAREESFDVEFLLSSSWRDTKLRLPSEKRKGRERHIKPSEAWVPIYDFINAIDQVKAKREGNLHVDDDGNVTWAVRYSGKFSSQLDLSRFPFDRQDLSITIAPFDTHEIDVDLTVDRKKTGRWRGAFLTDWQIDGVDAKIEPARGDFQDIGHNAYLFAIDVSRKSQYFVWRVLLPMALLVSASWAVFWFEPTNLQPLISTAMAILLSLVTFHFSIDFSLPKVDYLTFLDRFALTSLSAVLLAILAVTYIHTTLRRNGLEAALRAQRLGRIVFPVGYASVQILDALLTLFVLR